MSPGRPPTTGFKSMTRPDTSQTNTTLRNAALRTLCLPKNNYEEEEAKLRCLSERTAQKNSAAFVNSLITNGPGSSRQKPPNYASLGEYRPEVQKVAKAAVADNPKFQEMLEMIGEKVRQKFSKARDVFRFIDSDHSGSISRSEVRYFFRFFNIPKEEADQFFDGFEVDEENEISYVDFVKYLWPHVNPGNEQLHWSLAKDERKDEPDERIPQRVFTNASGETVQAEEVELPRELVRAKVNISQRLELRYKSTREAFRDLDRDKDGDITKEEIQRFLGYFGWAHTADRFYDVLIERGQGTISYRVFTGLFVNAKESDFRLRL